MLRTSPTTLRKYTLTKHTDAKVFDKLGFPTSAALIPAYSRRFPPRDRESRRSSFISAPRSCLRELKPPAKFLPPDFPRSAHDVPWRDTQLMEEGEATEDVARVTADKFRILIVDDDTGVQQSLVWSLRQFDATFEVFGTPSGVLAIAAPETPSCLIVDLRLPEMCGLDLLKTLRAKGWGMPFVIITGFGDVAGAVAAMQLGALHFLEKPVNEAELVRIIQTAYEQDCERLDKHRLHLEFEAKLAMLTPRETDVLNAVVEGKLNKQIASDLGLSIKTIETHRSNLTRKLEVNSVAQLVRLMVESAE